MFKYIYLTVLSVLIFSLSLFAQDSIPFPKKLDNTGFRDVLVQVGDVYISGQPDKESFTKLKEWGITTVVNLRTDREMANRSYVPFDEKKVLDSLDFKYVHIPLGGDDNPYTHEALKKFADALNAADGKVLLHCTVAWRASHMWAAYLIEYKDFTPVMAIEHAKAINFGDLPLEGLLGKKMIVDFE